MNDRWDDRWDDLGNAVGSVDGPPLVVITGPAGIGRSTALAGLGERLAGRRMRVVGMRFTPAGTALPGAPTQRPGPAHSGPVSAPWTPIGPATGARDTPHVARWAAAAAAAPLLVTGNAVLLIDDVQWIDPDSLAVLESFVRRVAGTTVRCVCAVRTPAPGLAGSDVAAGIARLRSDGLLHTVRVRPLDRDGVADVVRSVVRAEPDAALVTRLHAAGRGIPAALHAALDDLRDTGRVRVVDGHAYLVRSTIAAPGPGPDLLRHVRGLGPRVWSAAKAAAVLHPLGAALPALVGAGLDGTEQEAAQLLAVLRAEGVLHRGRHGASWRFTVPVVADALAAHLGPYEKRQLAARAVTALWAGEARTDDPDHLTDRVADAGRLVNPDRARTELTRRAGAVMRTQPERAERWWRAAAELAEDRPGRAAALRMQAMTCYLGGDYERSMVGNEAVLRYDADQLPADLLQDVQIMLVSAMHSVGDVAGLQDVAAGRRLWQGTGTGRTLSRAVALGLLDRWGETRTLLATTRDAWSTDAVAAPLGGLFAMLADVWTGHPARFEERVAAGGQGPPDLHPQHRLNHVTAIVSTLLSLGDLRSAEQMMDREHVTAAQLGPSDQALLASLRGHVEDGLDLMRRSTAGGSTRGHDTGRAPMLQAVAYLLVARGQLSRARDLLASARSAGPVLGHLLDNPGAEIDRVLGDDERAEQQLTATLGSTAERGLVVGAELTWAQFADLALERGDRDGARRSLVEIDRVAATVRTSRSRMFALLVRASVERDTVAAGECLRVCRERGQPFELAMTISKLVRYGVGDPADLPEAYEIFGGLDALLCRAWTRNLMERHDVAVPGRAVTVAENERLLALLVADGLSNKQLAFVLRTSAKSVEGRLSRLFTRTGYRSRIELAAAMRSGGYPG